MNPARGAVDVKRNLEGVYRMRFERTETKRHQLELQLNVINCYVQVAQEPSVQQSQVSSSDIHTRLTEIENSVKEIRHLLNNEWSAPVTGLTQAELEDCEYIAKLELESISYKPERILLTLVVEALKPFVVNFISSEADLRPSCYITCDRTNLMRVLRAVKSLFPTVGKVDVKYDNESSSLMLRLSNSADHNWLANLFEQVEHIISGQIVPLEYQNVSMLFIARCLTQSMGGDVTLEGNEVIIAIPGDLDCTIVAVNEDVPALREIRPASITPPPVFDNANVALTNDVETNSTSINNRSDTPPVVGKSMTGLPPIDVLKGRNLNILLVEDNNTLQEIFKRWWEKRGHNVFIAKDGQEAVNKFKEQNFSIVFSDIQLPIKDGFAVTREIRAYEIEKGRNPTPIIGVSGHEGNAQRALSSGMNDFTSKGTTFQMRKIYDLVVKYCVT